MDGSAKATAVYLSKGLYIYITYHILPHLFSANSGSVCRLNEVENVCSSASTTK